MRTDVNQDCQDKYQEIGKKSLYYGISVIDPRK